MMKIPFNQTKNKFIERHTRAVTLIKKMVPMGYRLREISNLSSIPYKTIVYVWQNMVTFGLVDETISCNLRSLYIRKRRTDLLEYFRYRGAYEAARIDNPKKMIHRIPTYLAPSKRRAIAERVKKYNITEEEVRAFHRIDDIDELKS